MPGGSTGRAVSNIVRRCEPEVVASYAGGTALLVIMESSCTSRARRMEAVRDAMGRPGRSLGLTVYTPSEVEELKGEPESGLAPILAECKPLYGSLDRFLRARRIR